MTVLLDSVYWVPFSYHLKERGFDVNRQSHSEVALIATHSLTPEIKHKVILKGVKWEVPDSLSSYADQFLANIANGSA